MPAGPVLSVGQTYCCYHCGFASWNWIQLELWLLSFSQCVPSTVIVLEWWLVATTKFIYVCQWVLGACMRTMPNIWTVNVRTGMSAQETGGQCARPLLGRHYKCHRHMPPAHLTAWSKLSLTFNFAHHSVNGPLLKSSVLLIAIINNWMLLSFSCVPSTMVVIEWHVVAKI